MKSQNIKTITDHPANLLQFKGPIRGVTVFNVDTERIEVVDINCNAIGFNEGYDELYLVFFDTERTDKKMFMHKIDIDGAKNIITGFMKSGQLTLIPYLSSNLIKDYVDSGMFSIVKHC